MNQSIRSFRSQTPAEPGDSTRQVIASHCVREVPMVRQELDWEEGEYEPEACGFTNALLANYF